MVITLDLTWISTLIPFLLIGFGLGYLCTLGVTGGPDKQIERTKHEIAVRKEWFAMLADQKTKNSKWPASWEEKLGEKNDRRN